jgi:hypothetical protein
MKTKIQKFKPTIANLTLLDIVLRRAIRYGYKNRNKSILPACKNWRKDDVRDAIKAYRMIKATEVQNVD